MRLNNTLKAILILILLSISAIIYAYLLASGSNQWTKDFNHHNSAKIHELKLIGQQSFWTVWYPGEDEIFGKHDFKLADSSNPLGILKSDPSAQDDIIVNGSEFHLIQHQKYKFLILSKDVLHTAYFPNFRAQMNAVPGMETSLTLTPQKTTEEMRLHPNIKSQTNDTLSDFDFILQCNEVCGANHFKMRMNIIVDKNKEDFDKWLNQLPQGR